MLTKNTLKKLYAAPFDTRIWNGNFAIANVEISNNKKRYQLSYELSHPGLEMFSGKRDKAKLTIWEGNCGHHTNYIPKELDELVKNAKASAQALLDEKVGELVEINFEVMREFRKAFFPHMKD